MSIDTFRTTTGLGEVTTPANKLVFCDVDLSTLERNNLEDRVMSTSLPTIEIFRDAEKYNLYQRFVATYTGVDRVLPELQRQVNGETVNYNFAIMSGMTDSASHMIHVREAHKSFTDYTPDQRYFVVTTDFGSMDTTEWHIKDATHTRDYEGSKFTLILDSHKSYDNFAEAVPNPNDSVLGEVRVARIMENILKHRRAEEVQLQFCNGPAKLWWGNFKEPEQFIGMDQVSSELYTLAKAYRAGMLGDIKLNPLFEQQYLLDATH